MSLGRDRREGPLEQRFGNGSPAPRRYRELSARLPVGNSGGTADCGNHRTSRTRHQNGSFLPEMRCSPLKYTKYSCGTAPFSNKKFLRAVCGAGFFIIVQFGSLGLIRLIRHVGKFNTGKVILFFLLSGIITAILLAGIAAAIL